MDKRGLFQTSSGLINDLPSQIHLLTLEPWQESPKQFLLRLENYFEVNNGGSTVQVDIGVRISLLMVY